ncbi:MAG: diaminopimelate decarboxylase [Salibacteraceae bacterium]
MRSKLVEYFSEQETPFYYYDLDLLKANLVALKLASENRGFEVHYAVKANYNHQVLETIMHAGLGADCVSGGEVSRAIEVGFSNDKIVFAGVGKTDREINLGLDNDIFCFNCESTAELKVIDELAYAKGKIANVALRLNPNVNANTHAYITTGLEENKFGINSWELESVFETLNESRNIKLVGIHFHIGSQITDLSSYKNLCNKVNEIQRWFTDRNIELEHINVGGGLGIDYENPDENPIPDYEAYFKLFEDFLELKPNQKLHFELGRSIVAQMGSLVSRVVYIKKGLKTNFAILDAGMTELIRPALYQSYHQIQNASKFYRDDLVKEKYDVVGPICESSDCFGKAVIMPETQRGDLVIIRSAGAYAEVMASGYNLREKAQVLFGPQFED